MPVAEAAVMLEKSAGLGLPEKTLERVAKKAAGQARQQRMELDEDARQGRDTPSSRGEKQPATVIIEIDAWNIREGSDR